MMNNYNKPKKNLTDTNNIEFGIALEKAFENYKKIAGTVGISFLILTVVYCVILFGLMGVAYGFGDFTQTMTTFSLGEHSSFFSIGYLLVLCVVTGILTNIYAGIYRIAHSAEVDKSYDIGTSFYYFKTKYFKELFLAGAMTSLVTSSITLSLQYLSKDILTTLIASGITYMVLFFTILSTPLIIFSDLKAIDALLLSIQLVLKNFFTVLGLIVLSAVLSMLGIIGLCIGIFFTVPFMFSTVYTIYNEILPIEEASIIDEIGVKEE